MIERRWHAKRQPLIAHPMPDVNHPPNESSIVTKPGNVAEVGGPFPDVRGDDFFQTSKVRFCRSLALKDRVSEFVCDKRVQNDVSFSD